MDGNDPPEGHRTGSEEERLAHEVGRKAERKRRARSERRPTVWFGLGMFGLVGWSVAVPTVVGVAIGLWLDRRWPGEISWTLTFLFIGVSVGCLNAWYWLKNEHRRG